MGYTPNNNPYIPGDPYSYDLKWIVEELKKKATKEGIDLMLLKFDELKAYVDDYFANLNIQPEINAKIDDMIDDGTFQAIIESIIDETDAEEVILTYIGKHTGAYETSYIVLKIPKDIYKLSFHYSDGNDNNSPNDSTNSDSNALKFLENHMQYDVCHNFNFGGSDYPYRFNGTEYTGTDLSYRLFGYDDTTEDWTVTASGAAIGTVPANFNNVFEVGGLLISNGTINSSADAVIPNVRAAFGSDDDYWYVLYCEGRGNYERGLTLMDMAIILYDLGCKDAINIDGGGSVCLAVNDGMNAIKVNKFRDQTVPYPQLRNTAIIACYEKRS